MATKNDVYKGKPVITLAKDDATLNNEQSWGRFSFGQAKAELILANIADIVQFVQSIGGNTSGVMVEAAADPVSNVRVLKRA